MGSTESLSDNDHDDDDDGDPQLEAQLTFTQRKVQFDLKSAFPKELSCIVAYKTLCFQT